MTTLTFNAWSREKIGRLAHDGMQQGRASGSAAVTLAGTDAGGAPTSTQTGTVAFLLAGPPDVTGLRPGAVTDRYPAPGTPDAESDKCPYVELAVPQLPWSYSPDGNPSTASGDLRAWLALVVGVEGEELTLAAGKVALTPALQQDHLLGGTRTRWAHEQVDEAGRHTGRVLSGRALAAGVEYVAVLVPAFTAAGQPAWTGAAPVTVPVFDVWRFRTSEIPGSFRDLAAKLKPGDADENTGRAPVDYPRVPAAPDLEIRGALAPIGAQDDPLPAPVGTDLAGLRTPARDPDGRPIVGLPRYGDAWRPDADATAWGKTMNDDPRFRGLAGLGSDMGIRFQEDLVADVTEHLGALQEAAQRVSQLVAGLHASGGLWSTRLPADPLHRLWVLGPALRRVVSTDGIVADLATAAGRALPAGIFSTAARRILRPGPARTRRLSKPFTPADVLVAANRCPVPPRPSADGVPLDVLGIAELDERIKALLDEGRVDHGRMVAVVEKLDAGRVDPRLRDLFEAVRRQLRESADRGGAAPWAWAVQLLVEAVAPPDPEDPDRTRRLGVEFRRLLELWFDLGVESSDMVDLIDAVRDQPGKEPPCRPVDLGGLAEGVTQAFDPTGPAAPVLIRVIDTISGLDPAQPLAPPEVCVGLDRPVWRDVEQAFPQWLLPGVNALPEDSVIALETNPSFTDACVLGYNQQLLGELRWRNIPVATGCTPMRVFWDRANTQSGERIDDIVGIANWATGTDVGEASHRPGGAAGKDLALVVRGQLFVRYPRTVVYLVSAVHGGAADFDVDPDAAAPRTLPSFQGRIGTDVTFFGFQGMPAAEVLTHWIVFEEPPHGYRFYNLSEPEAQGVAPTADGADWASATFADPVRVLIKGPDLLPDGGP
jgi:hypothetical protein